MPVLLDDQTVDFGVQQLGEVLGKANEQATAQGRLVVEVSIDGRVLNHNELQEMAQVPTVAVTVGLKTANMKDLALETLDQAQDQLDSVRDLQEDAADLLQEDKAIEGFEKIGKLIEMWIQTQQAVGGVAQLMKLDLSKVQVDDQPLSTVSESMVQQLMQLKEAIEAGDTVTLSDALAYEWPEQVDRWERLIVSVSEAVDPTRRGG